MAEKKKTIAESPLAGSTVGNLVRLALEAGPVEMPYLGRAGYVAAMTLLWSPFRLAQRLFFDRRVRRTELPRDPVFILGHFRSGTTHLQNLLAQDRQWGYVSTTQAVVPGMFLLGPWVRALLGFFLPKQRPMDNMAMAPELPEEPEHAIGNLSRHCFYHGFCFPRRMRDYFERAVLFSGADEAAVAEWRRTYRWVLKAATYASSGRPLLVKNPPDTARIPHLLAEFPRAKFIFLYRNPYVLYPSILNFYTSILNDWALQEHSAEELRENIFTFFAAMHARYDEDRERIAPGNLVEVKFEDVESRPLDELRRIYEELRLDGFAAAAPAFRDYLAAQTTYRKNRYALDEPTAAEIARRWSREVERGAYAPPDGLVS